MGGANHPDRRLFPVASHVSLNPLHRRCGRRSLPQPGPATDATGPSGNRFVWETPQVKVYFDTNDVLYFTLLRSPWANHLEGTWVDF